MPRAEFHSYQENFDDKPPFVLFNIVGGERDGSTVGLQTLKDLGIEVPDYPTFETWRKPQ